MLQEQADRCWHPLSERIEVGAPGLRKRQRTLLRKEQGREVWKQPGTTPGFARKLDFVNALIDPSLEYKGNHLTNWKHL